MKKNGFTLVEMVISLVILVAIGLVVASGLNKLFNKNEDEGYESLVNRITSSADVYLSNNATLTSSLYTNRGFIIIKINDLIEEGLLENDLINPKTGEKIGSNELVLISLDANGSIVFTYPAENNKGDYLQTINKVLPFGSTYDCYADLDTVNLGYIDKDGLLLTPYFKDATGNRKSSLIECLNSDVDTRRIGTYEVKYNYVTPEGVTKQATRNFLVQDNEPPKFGNFSSSVSVLGTSSWYTALTRSITATDNESGLLKVEYCISTSSTCTPNITYPQGGVQNSLTVNAPFTANKNKQYLCVKATDASGNATTKCDSGFKVDTTKPTGASIRFSNTLREWTITNATDNESNISKYECRYGTSSTNLNQTASVSGTKCVMPKGSFQPGVTYYVKLVATNGAGLVLETPIISGKWTYVMADAYKDNCANKTYCKSPQSPFYVKYGSKVFVVYNAANNGAGYRAVLNGAYKQTSYWVPSCDGYKLVSENFAQIYNTTLNREFISEIPTNYRSKLNFASWCIGNYTALNNGCDKKVTTYIGLVSYPEFAQMRSTNNFKSGVGNNLYWLSNYGSYYIPVEQVKDDNTEIDENASQGGTTTPNVTIVNELNYSYYIASGSSATIQAINSSNTWARPVVEFNKSAEICSGAGTSVSSPYVLC